MKISTIQLLGFIAAVTATTTAIRNGPYCSAGETINSHGRCFNLPPAAVENYTAKGTFKEFAGMRTYVTGDEKSKKAVFFVHDIGGHLWKTLQGADLIASAGYLVVIPDFFFGQAIDINLFTPPMTPEKAAAIQDWLNSPIPDLQTALTNAHKVVPAIKAHYKRRTKAWGSIGLCWGTKTVTLLSQKNSLFDNVMTCHPSNFDPADAPGLTVPNLLLASSGENATDVQTFKEVLENHPIKEVRQKSYVETYETMPHGWMGGTAELSNPDAKAEYERGYRKVVEFLWQTI